jgi:hypothetical protein
MIGIDFGCGEHVTVPGWPGDQEGMERARRESYLSVPRPSRRSAFEGALLGLAVGHARGAAALASDVDGSRAHDDDTALSLNVAESLIAASPTGAAGATSVKLSRRGEDAERCTAILHGVPIGLFFWRHATRAMEAARSRGVEADGPVEIAPAVALLTALALGKRPPARMHRELMEQWSGATGRHTWWRRLPELVGAEPELALSVLGQGNRGSIERAVVAALWCFWQSPEDYAGTMIAARGSRDDPVRVACLAGALSGAFNGCDAIPAAWRAAVRNADAVLEVARRLWEAAP